MRNFILILFAVLFSLSLAGCCTLKNTAVGTASTLYGFAKGLVTDTYNTFKALNKADKWFKKNCW